jgi:hypothetical protein
MLGTLYSRNLATERKGFAENLSKNESVDFRQQIRIVQPKKLQISPLRRFAPSVEMTTSELQFTPQG